VHPSVFATFDRVCRARRAGGAVLEIGAVPSPDALLLLPALAGATERVGVSLDGPSSYGGFEIVRDDANDLAAFPDARFDTVLCNSVLEHDPRFWRTLASIRRVARPGALVVIGVPGYAPVRPSRWLRAAAAAGRRTRWRALAAWAEARLASTPTLVVHRCPEDYYRFTEAAVREVFLEGLDAPDVETVLSPPRFVGAGTLPSGPRRGDVTRGR